MTFHKEKIIKIPKGQKRHWKEGRKNKMDEGTAELIAEIIWATILSLPLLAFLTEHWIGYAIGIIWGWFIITLLILSDSNTFPPT